MLKESQIDMVRGVVEIVFDGVDPDPGKRPRSMDDIKRPPGCGWERVKLR